MSHQETTWFDGTAGRTVLVDRLVSNLAFARIRSVAFVVSSGVSWTLPLYDVAIATARRGWKIGIEEARYWFVTPEPEPLAWIGTGVSAVASQRLEPEGIAFIGSTYPDVRDGLVLLDPQGESLEADLVVSLDHSGAFDVTFSSVRPPVSRVHRPRRDGTATAGNGMHVVSSAAAGVRIRR
jgi:hypothetical protein